MDLSDQKLAYDPFDEADKSNDSAHHLDVVWTSTQSPGNQVLNKMLRDAQNAKQKRQSMLAQNSTNTWPFQAEEIKVPLRITPSTNDSSNTSSSYSSSHPRATHRRRPHSSGYQLRNAEPDPQFYLREDLNPSLRAQGSTQLARDRLADIIKSVRDSLDERTLEWDERDESLNEGEEGDWTEQHYFDGESTQSLVPTVPLGSQHTAGGFSPAISRENSWTEQPAPLTACNSLAELSSAPRMMNPLLASQSLGEIQPASTQTFTQYQAIPELSQPPPPTIQAHPVPPPLENVKSFNQAPTPISAQVQGQGPSLSKRPSTRRPLGMRPNQMLHTTGTSATSNRTKFRPPLASSKVVPNVSHGGSGTTNSKRQVAYPKADIDPDSVPFSQNTRYSGGGVKQAQKKSACQPSEQAFVPPRASSPCPPTSRVRTRNQNRAYGIDLPTGTGTRYRETLNEVQDLSGLGRELELEFTPPKPFSQTDGIDIRECALNQHNNKAAEDEGDGDGDGEDKGQTYDAPNRDATLDKSDSSFGPMDIDLEELERVCSQYD